MKVKGMQRPDGKRDYVLSHNGRQFLAVNHGHYFLLEGVSGTLKSLKQRVIEGYFDVVPDRPIEVSPDDPSEAEDYDSKPQLWDCVEPCALLTLLFLEHPSGKYGSEIFRTLDNHGYLNEAKFPDEERARHDYEQQKEQKDVAT